MKGIGKKHKKPGVYGIVFIVMTAVFVIYLLANILMPHDIHITYVASKKTDITGYQTVWTTSGRIVLYCEENLVKKTGGRFHEDDPYVINCRFKGFQVLYDTADGKDMKWIVPVFEVID